MDILNEVEHLICKRIEFNLPNHFIPFVLSLLIYPSLPGVEGARALPHIATSFTEKQLV
ncbi:hypothetical protein [Methanothrix sp.]